MLTHLLMTAALLAGPGPAPPGPDLARVDSLVAAWVEARTVAGAVIVVSWKGETVLERAYGWAALHGYGEGQYPQSSPAEPPPAPPRLPEPLAMSTGTVFDLASVTKVMATTFAVMLLVDDGILDLDAPVNRYLPDFTGGGKDGITLRHLLTHRGGLAQWKPVYYHAGDAQAAYRYVRDLPLGWPVGEARHYSDLGFMLLGRVVEQVTGVSLPSFLQSRLYGPLGLTATGFTPRGGPFAATSHGNPFERRMVHDPDFGYRIEGDPWAWDGWRRRTLVGEVNDGNAHHALGGVAGHAGLFSTAGDLTVLLRLLLGGGELDGRRFVGAETVRTFLSSTGEGQALGWQSPEYAPDGSFAHTGFTGTYVLGVPGEDLGVVLLTNRQHGGVDARGQYPDLGALQRAVAAALVNGS